MKLLVLSVIFALVAASQQQNEQFDKVTDLWLKLFTSHQAECVAETKVEQHLIEDMAKNGKFPDFRPLKCYTKCIFLHLKIMNEAGVIDSEVLKKIIGIDDPATIEKLFGRCLSIKSKDHCETAFDFSKCIWENAKAMLVAQ